ncbi:D-alanyl-D-alanine carboxypeptidase family protein [uncultured Ilyobacter sp.]|uniref:D-alanyl-D-alanine carboxypeptidase family protein n=1 Tax=uncultured Ilyobacter sp. TaxID=544433 RepID=UPI0029C6A581|nr:D-alanyl-D-alanine carboxypeptidase family protein [uncultured Ilyobacter sp.]
MRKKICIFLSVIFCLITFANGNYTSLLLGDSHGNIYYSENIYEKHPIASVTKMMTVMVAYDRIRNEEIDLDDRVEISPKARAVGGSMIWISEGAKLTVRDLIKATSIYSANNAAYALAEYIGMGDVDFFVKLMNQKAKELGLENELEFYTPMGLPPSMTGKPMDRGTALGIYKLSLEALKYKEYITIASSKEDFIQDGAQRILNRNKLISEENGVYGIKTGHHSEAGYNISIVAKRNDITTITVVFGSPDAETRDRTVLTSLDKFYDEYQLKKLIDLSKPMVKIDIKDGEKDVIYAYPNEEFEQLISKNWGVKIRRTYIKSIEAPVKSGEVLGSYQLIVNGKEIKDGRLYSRESVEKNKFIDKIRKIF